MSSGPSFSGTPPHTGSGPETILKRFEEAWRRGEVPRLEEYVAALRAADPAASAAQTRAFVAELVQIDLNYRWRPTERRSAGPHAWTARGGGASAERWLLEDYCRKLPEMGAARRLSLELIGEEYRVRRYAGDPVRHAGYSERFGGRGPDLLATLTRIDVELARELTRSPAVERPAPSDIVALTDTAPARTGPTPSLRDLVRGLEPLLATTDFRTVTGELVQRFPEPLGLTKELLRRAWLTPYQANQLLRGLGPSLVLGPYIVLERLGAGGLGQVFKARHQRLCRLTALKVIHPDLVADAEVLGRFYREIHVISRLNFPHIVHAFDAGLAGTTHFLAMEYVEGSDLSQLIKRDGPLPVARACEYVRQAALGLQHIHEHGLVHRDIKPSNLMLAQAHGAQSVGLVKILDLGLARLRRTPREGAVPDGATTLTPRTGMCVMGTPDYVAPEQTIDFHATDIRADIYGLGCTFYYLLTGQPPFPGGTVVEKLWRHQGVEPPVSERPDVPAELRDLLRRLMAKKPEDRPQTPAEVVAAVTTIGSRLPSSPGPPSAVRPETATVARRRRMVAAGLAVILTGMLLFARWLNKPTQPFPGCPEELVAVLAARLGEASMPDRYSGVLCVTFSADGALLASGHADATLRMWDLRDPERTETLVSDRAGLGQKFTQFSPTGARLLASTRLGGSPPILLYDMADKKPRPLPALPDQPHSIRGLTFAADGTMLAASSADDTVRIWRLGGGASKPTVVKGNIHSLAFSPDSRLLVGGAEDGALFLWDLTQAPAPVVSQVKPAPNSRVVGVLAFAPDGRTLASASADKSKSLRLWKRDGMKLEEAPVAIDQAPDVVSLAFLPDGKTLVSAGRNGQVGFWDVAGAKPSREPWRFPAQINSMALACDGRFLAVGCANGNIYLLRIPR